MSELDQLESTNKGGDKLFDNIIEAYSEERLKKINKWNIVACGLHLVQAIAQMILGFTVESFSNFKLPLRVYFLSFKQITDNNGDVIAEYLDTSSSTITNFGFAPFISLFFFLSALFHFIVISPWFNKIYHRQLNQGKNYFRWIEYSVSSTLMIWLIAMLFGMYDIATLLGISSLNASMNLCGLMMEKYNSVRDVKKPITWFPFWVGCLTGFTPWILIFTYLAASSTDATTQIPGFVWGILVGYLIFFQSFPINMILQYKRIGKWKDYLVGEMTYIILSLVAKTFLGWLVFGGLNQPNKYT